MVAAWKIQLAGWILELFQRYAQHVEGEVVVIVKSKPRIHREFATGVRLLKNRNHEDPQTL